MSDLKQQRRVCVVTGSRADYGLLYWLLIELKSDPDIELQLVVTGMHLSPVFGLTYRVIEEDGFLINEKLEMLLAGDTLGSTTKSMGIGMISFAQTFDRLKPDILVVLGDRCEIFSAAIAAMNSQIPIAHIAGGEASEGMIDEAIRHSITKMAYIHFPGGEKQRQRVLQLGEDPSRIYCFGKPGLDNIRRLNLLDREAIERELDFSFEPNTFIITFHPVTLEDNTSKVQFQTLLSVLDNFPESRLIFTFPNSDAYGNIILTMINEYVASNKSRARVFANLGQFRYLSCVKNAHVIIGNSSSGLIEAPLLRVPTVNIGDRQRGRVSADSVINCDASVRGITKAINKALTSEFREKLKDMEPPHNSDGKISIRIKNTLKTVEINKELMKKRFYEVVKTIPV
ncbi:MAG: UDP-N-acetylglucosamine 2-epimerase (hydrolyzing) [Parcubacteria group bacterium]|nr:UDP-N-acetylglucosamine 2-epimerase (hydrolyzing) [Parcubacteria group bacterium]